MAVTPTSQRPVYYLRQTGSNSHILFEARDSESGNGKAATRIHPKKQQPDPAFGRKDKKEMSARWDNHFLGLALCHAKLSKDPSTQVGSIIVGPDREVVSAGFNGFPRGIADTNIRLRNRETKMKLMVHAEMNAVLAAARAGIKLKGCTLYLAATDDSGKVWGGPPCTRCVVEIIQAGISEIVSFPVRNIPSRWHEDLKYAKQLLFEAGINYREVNTSTKQKS